MNFKCKMCGGELIMQTRTIGVCSYCKSKQTVIAAQDRNHIDLFQRAEAFRMNGDFDQAARILESVIAEGQADAELHWALALCRYGIVYVEDPQTHKQLPTFYRLKKQSFLTDPDYLEAVNIAGEAEKAIYIEQASEIVRIQQRINQYLDNGELYDVFISYKETDNQGDRTKDSEIAHQIYNALTKENIRVFYSHISLENKLGEDYEAVIYSALMSSKLMLLVMTDTENAEAAWVKNEWKRYLSLINQDNTRRLIPVLYGVRPETMPAELSHLKLQALDFTKLGAIEDLVHNVKKIIKTGKKQTDQADLDENEKALRTAFFDLADHKFTLAEIYSRDLLVRDPENARGHFCYFAAVRKLPISSEEDLIVFYKNMLNGKNATAIEKPLEKIIEEFVSYADDFHYQQAYKLGDQNYKNLLDTVHAEIENLLISKIDEKASEATTAEDHYRAAVMYGFFPDNVYAVQKKADHLKIKNSADAQEQYDILMVMADHAVTFRDCMDVADMFDSLNYRDSASQAAELRNRGCILGYELADKMAKSATSDADHSKAAQIFEELAKYGYKDSSDRMKDEQSIVNEMLIMEAIKYAEEHPTANGYLKAADMLKSIDCEKARKYEKKYRQSAIEAAKSKTDTKINDSPEAQRRYDDLMDQADHAVTFSDCMNVAQMFDSLNYRDSASQAAELRQRGCIIGYQLADKMARSATSEIDHLDAARIFEELAKYGYKDSLRRMQEEKRIVYEECIKQAKKYAEEHPTADGYLKAADMLKSIDYEKARRDEKKYKEYAKKAATSKDGVYIPNADAKKSVSIVCSLFAVLMIGFWVFLLLTNIINDAFQDTWGTPPMDATSQFILTALVGLPFGIAYGFIIHFCRYKKFFHLLFFAAAVLLPIYHAATGHAFFKFDATSVWRTEEYARYIPYLFGALMIPSHAAARFIAYASWQSILKAAAWIIGGYILTMAFMKINFGAWGSSLQKYHRSLSEVQQIAFFPIISLAGALLFGFCGKITKVSRLMDILFVAVVFSLTIYGPNFIWKTNIYKNLGISRQVFLGILLLPSLVVFFIPRESKKGNRRRSG